MAVEGVPTFQWADYLVLGLFLLFNTCLGLFFGIIDRKQKNAKSFLLGGGDMHYIPVALSMQASFLSAIFIISTPTEIYNFGTLYAYMAISYWIGLPIAAYMYLPTYRKLKLTSAYEVSSIYFSNVHDPK
jgi:solute carrier family 5 (sodium-coupled monocarboxylate transporter), member 8/12